MSPQRLPRPLRGIVPPLATPLLDSQTLDLNGTDRLVDHVISGGVAGIFVLGTCGEGNAIGAELQTKFVNRVCDATAGRVPVLVGVSSPALNDSLALAEHAARAGAAAIVATPPFYYPVSDIALTEHLRRLARRSPLPLVLYNMPGCTHNSITPTMLHSLASEQNIAGIKDSSGSLEVFTALCNTARELRDDWCVLMGPEEMLADAVAVGGDGGVSGGANVCPQLFVDLFAAAERGDAESVNALKAETQFLARCYDSPTTATSVIQGLKTALAEAGICSGITSELFPPVSDERRTDIREWVNALRARGAISAAQ